MQDWRACRINNCFERSDWMCRVFGGEITITPEKGKEPNRFHRFMQEIIFGVKWVRRSKTQSEGAGGWT